MKCTNCGKDIPETSQACPFCFTAIENNNNTTTTVNVDNETQLTTINTSYQDGDNNELNFGDMDNNTSFDENTLEAYINEPKKRRKILLPIICILAGFIVLFIILSMLAGAKIESYKYYTGVVNTVYEYIDENFTSSNAKNSGKYKFAYTIGDESKEFKGKYQYDLSKKIINLTGDLKNPEEEQGGIVVNDKTLTFETFLKNNEIYFVSKNIYNLPILLPYEDETGLLTTNKYDLSALVEGIKDATNTALKNMTYGEEKKVNINVKGNSKTYDKKILVLDYQAKKKFISIFYETLIEDSNFIAEYARISGKKSDEIAKLLNNYKTTFEYKYNKDDGHKTTINIYYKKDKVYRIESIMDEEKKSKIIIDIDNNKLFLDYYEDERVTFSISIKRIDSYMNEILTRDYVVEMLYNEQTINFTLELEKDNDPKVKANEVAEYKSIRDLTEEEVNVLKSNIKVYNLDESLIDTLRDVFKTKCSKELSCLCNNDEICQCTFGNGIIACPRTLVEPEEENKPEE